MIDREVLADKIRAGYYADGKLDWLAAADAAIAELAPPHPGTATRPDDTELRRVALEMALRLGPSIDAETGKPFGLLAIAGAILLFLKGE